MKQIMMVKFGNEFTVHTRAKLWRVITDRLLSVTPLADNVMHFYRWYLSLHVAFCRRIKRLKSYLVDGVQSYYSLTLVFQTYSVVKLLQS